jgi:hypothetical protein
VSAVSEAAAAARRAEGRAAAAITVALDVLTDFCVAALAVWTILYHASLVVSIPTDALLIGWAVLSAVLTATVLRREWTPGRPAPAGPRQPTVLIGTALAAAAGAGFLIAQGTGVTWWAGWTVAAVLVVAALGVALRRRSPRRPRQRPDEPDEPAPRPWLALLVAGALATLTLFTYYIDTDDTLYVSKSVWVASHGTIATRDTLFSDERIGHLAGAGVPVQALESLQGALAHLFGAAAPTLVYLITPPTTVALAVWALWRLVREWAPRRATLAFLVGGVYLAVSLLGSWTMLRMWMGKAIFFALVVPLLYLYLTRWVDRSRPRDALLLAAAGCTAVGLMSSATVVAAILGGAAAAVALLGASRPIAAGALLAVAYPVGVGFVVAALAPPGDPGGDFHTGQAAFSVTFGSAVVAGVGWAAVVAAAALARSRGGRLVGLGAAAATVLVACPPVTLAINAATSSGAVLYRLLWVAPVPVMVGLLATVPLPRLPWWALWAKAIPAAALIWVLLATGTVYWARVPLLRKPAWKVDPVALAESRAIGRLDPGPGPVLAPRTTMTAIGITTVDFHAVSPNASYIYRRVIPESPADTDARITLHRLMYGRPLAADVARAPAALDRLDVSLVCLYPTQRAARAVTRTAGYVVDRGEASGLRCFGRGPVSGPGG